MSFRQQILSKIITQDVLLTYISSLKKESKKIVFTNGCFDLLHRGHVDYLCKARDLGDVLIVGLNSDNSVKGLEKGSARPLQDQNSRAEILASLSFVDFVVVFDESTPEKLIRLILPDVLVKGGDYMPEQVVGKEMVEQNGGKLILIPFLEGYSTSGIERKIIKSIEK